MDVFDLAAKISLDSSEYEKNIGKAKTSSEDLGKALEKASGQSETTKNKIEVLGHSYNQARERVEKLTAEFNKSAKETGTDSEQTRKLAQELNNAEKELQDVGSKLKEYNTDIEESADKTGGFADKLKAGLGTAAKVGAVAIGAAVTAVGVLTKKSIDAYAEYEQLEGGVKKLYGTAGKSLEEYARDTGKSVGEASAEYAKLEEAQNLMLSQANEAYKTSGMSANQYLEQATSFSAALINSLNGDTVAAAKQTDVAMRAISDNFNTFGGDIGMIQYAFQGFAKQNYTMLDNLKLGYGGTKQEMERLIKDANEYAKANGKAADLSIDSFSDIVTAIELVQEKQGIAGTTAKEAATTIEGSLNMTKAAWENLVAGFANPDADIGQLMDNLVTAIVGDKEGEGLLNQIIPAVQRALEGIGELIQRAVPILSEQLPALVSTMLPALLSAATSLVTSLVAALPSIIQILLSQAPMIISELANALIVSLPMLANASVQMIVMLANGISQNLPILIPAAINAILQVVDALVSNANMLAEAAVQLMMGLAQGLINAIPQLLMAIPQIVASLGNALIHGLREILGPVGDFLFGEVDVIGQEGADKAGQWGGQIENGFYTPQGGQPGSAGWSGNVYGVVDSTGQSAQKNARTWGGKIESGFYEGNGGSTGGGWGPNVIEYVEETGEETKRVAMRKSEETGRVYWEVLDDSTPDSESSGLVTGTEMLMEAAKQAALQKAAEMDEPGQEAVASMISGYTGESPEFVNDVIRTMQDAKTNADSWAAQMDESGELSAISLTDGMDSNRDAPINSMGDLVRDSYENGLTIAAGAKVVGTALASHAASGTTSSGGLVSGAARGVVSSAISSARGAAGGAHGVGTQIGSGIASGIQAMAQRIATAAAGVVSKALEAAKARAAIASPSKVFRDEVGKMLGLGVAEGMVSKDVLTALDKSASELTGDTVKDLETMVKAWDAVYDNYYEGLEHQNFFLELAGDTDAIIANYRKMQETLHEQKEHYLRMGVDANDSAIRDMEEQWWAYQDKIDGVYDGIAKKAEQTYDTMIDVMEHKLFLSEKQGKSPEERLAILEELMEETHKRAEALRAQGYTDDSKEIRELQKQWWGYHDEVEDINEGIAKGIKERNEKIASFMQSSANETIAYFEEIAEKAQKAYDEAFDAIMDKQKAMQDKLAGYGELYKSTTTTSGKTYVSLQDLDRQTKQLERYGEIIEELRSRGVSGNLMEDILGMGIDEGSEFGKRLLNMSEGGLSDYLASYQRKQDIAADIAARYYKPEFDALNGQNVELNVAEQRNLEYNEEQTSLLRRIAETFEGSGGQTVQVVVDGQVIANATFDDIVAVSKMRGLDIVNVKEG